MIIIILFTWIFLLISAYKTQISNTCSDPTGCEYIYDPNNASQCYCDNQCTNNGKRLLCFYLGTLKNNCSDSCSAVNMISACGKLCCAKDCLPEPWQDWSECQGPCGNVTGSRTRSRIVLADNMSMCGGLACPQLNETEACLTKCCAVDCQWTSWSVWGNCSNSCGDGYRFSTRTHLLEAACGGLSCTGDSIQNTTCTNYVNVDCIMDTWSDWSTCKLLNGKCGAGVQNRTRSIIQKSKCQGAPCEETYSNRTCQGQCCLKNCSMTLWTPWSFSNVSCGIGYQNRSRIIQQLNSCGGAACSPDTFEIQLVEQNVTRNCTLSSWSKWSPCSNSCGIGYQNSSRKVTLDEACGGFCDSNLTMNQSCESYSANVNCQVSQWSTWSACESDCNGGLQIKTRKITIKPVCQGNPCPALNMNRTCQPLCSQLCNSGICSCRLGYGLSSDGFTCLKQLCMSTPSVQFDPPGLIIKKQYEYVLYNCSNDPILVGDTCTVHCNRSDWILRGDLNNYTCGNSGYFNFQNMYCGPRHFPPTDISLDVTKVPERLTENVCFGNLKTTDNFDSSTYTYILVKNFESRLNINGHRLCLNYTPNYEAPNNTWSITIRSTNVIGLYIEKSFTISLINVNDPPSSCQFDTSGRIPENVGETYFIGNIIFDDDDNDTNLIKPFIIDGDSDNFEIYFNSSPSVMKYAVRVKTVSSVECQKNGGPCCHLNFETKNSFRITIEADQTGNPNTTSFFDLYINLLDKNDAPTRVFMKQTLIPENLNLGDAIGRLFVEDEDNMTQSYQFSLISGNLDYFQIDSNNSIVLRKSVNYEDKSVKNLNVAVKGLDNGKPPMSVTSNIIFTIVNVNESPNITLVSESVLTENIFHLTVTENNNIYTRISSIYISDPDVGENMTYKIQGQHDYIALIDNGCMTQNTQIQRTICQVDIIAQKVFIQKNVRSFNFNITIKDQGNLTIVGQFNVTVSSTMPKVVVFDMTNLSVIGLFENQIGINISKLTVLNGDNGYQNKFVIIEDQSGLFELLNDSMIKLKEDKTLHCDDSTNTSSITVGVSNSVNMFQTFNSTLTIIAKRAANASEGSNSSNPLGTNEIGNVIFSPRNMTLKGNSVLENSNIGTLIGILYSDDSDISSRLVFILPKNETNFLLSGNQLLSAKSFDYETTNKYQVNITMYDNRNLLMQISKVFDIDIVDVNEIPVIIVENIEGLETSVLFLPENSQIETTIGRVLVYDVDKNDTITCTIFPAMQEFRIKNSKVQANMSQFSIVTQGLFNYDEQNEYYININISENGNTTYSNLVIVKIGDVNKPPFNFTINGNNDSTIYIDENLVGPKMILSVTVGDFDQGDHLKFYVESCKNCEGKFEFMDNKCYLYLVNGAFFDFEMTRNVDMELVMSAVDSGNLSISRIVKISITNVQEPPIIIGLNNTSIPSYFESDFVIGSVIVTDEDEESEDNEVMCNVTTIEYDWLEIVNINKTQLLKTSRTHSLNNSEITFEIRCQEYQFPILSSTANVTLSIIDLDNEPITMEFASVTPRIEENSVNIIIGEIHLRRKLSKKYVDYTSANITHRWPSTVNISITDRGMIILISPVNYETMTSFVIYIEMNDKSVITKLENEIEILDINEAPSALAFSAANDTKLTTDGTSVFVGTISVSDEDRNQSHTFKITNITAYSKENGSHYNLDLSAISIVKYKLFIIASLNWVKTVDLEISCTDNGSKPMTKDFSLEIPIKINSPPTKIVFLNPSLMIPENLAINSTLESFVVVDYDTNDTYSCSSTNSNFQIFNFTIILAEELNFEFRKTVNTIIECADSSNQSIKAPWSINVEDVDEAPQDASLNSKQWDEDTVPGTLITNITALDPEGARCLYELVNCLPVVCPITISVNGSIFLKESLREIVDTDDLSLHIGVSDQHNNSNNFHLNTTIIRNNLPKISIIISNIIDVPENATIGTKLFDVSIQVLSGAETEVFCKAMTPEENVVVKGFEIILGKNIDYESSTNISVNVTCWKNTYQMLNWTNVIVNVTDIDEPIKEIIMNLSKSIYEGNYVTGLIGNILIKDPELDQLKINCTGINANLSFVFQTDTDTKSFLSYNVFITGNFSYNNSTGDYNISILCGDRVSSLMKNMTLAIRDTNDAPSELLINGTTTVDLDSRRNNEIIAKLYVVDEDVGQRHNIIVQRPCDKYFFITQNRNLKVRNLEYSWTGLFNCSFLVVDNGNPPLSAIFNKTFNFIKSDGEIVVTNYTFEITTKANTTVSNIQFLSNSTVNRTVSFKLENVPGNAFTVKGNQIILITDADQIPFQKVNLNIVVCDASTGDIITNANIRLMITGFSVCHSSMNNCTKNSSCQSIESNSTSFVCNCNDGFLDKNGLCVEINECESSPCFGNKSICQDLLNDFQCQCEQNRHGRTCEIVDSNLCNNAPCVNGICQDSKCSCTSGWQGTSCKDSINDCAADSCNHNGLCIDRHLGFVCKCYTGFDGIFCEYNTSACTTCDTATDCITIAIHQPYCTKSNDKITTNFSISNKTLDIPYFTFMFYQFLQRIPDFQNKTTSLIVNQLDSSNYQLVMASFDDLGKPVLSVGSWDIMKQTCSTMQLTPESDACHLVFKVIKVSVNNDKGSSKNINFSAKLIIIVMIFQYVV